MRITNVTLKNFRSHADTDIDLGAAPVTIIHGPNAAGKSTILDAIHYALLGWCRGTDERGAGAKNLVAAGAPMGMVVVNVIDAERTYPDKAMSAQVGAEIAAGGTTWFLDGRQTPAAKFRGALEERLRCDRDALHSCLDYRGFLGLHHARQKDVLLGALGLNLAEMDKQLEDAKVRRAALKKTLAGIPAAAPSVAQSAGTVAEIEEALSELRTEREKLIAHRGATVGRLEAVVAERQELELKLRGVPTAAAVTKAKKEMKAAQEKLVDLERMKAAIDGKLSELRGEKARLEGELAGCSSALSALSKMDGKCLVSGTIPCRVTKEEAGRIVPTFTGAMAKLQERIADLNREIREQEGGLRLSSVPEAEDVIRRAKEILGKAEAAKGMQDRLAELAARHEEAQSFTGPGVGEIDGQLKELAERIGNGEQMLRSARAAEGESARAQEAQRRRGELALELGQAEADCERFGPNGERAEIIAKSIGPFMEEVARVLIAFGMQPVGLSLDPWGILAVRDGQELPAELLSTSEQMRLSLALQIALARVTGIGVVALDGAEILDERGRAALSDVAEMGLVEQLLVCTTTADDFEAPEIPGVQFVRVGVPAFAGVA